MSFQEQALLLPQWVQIWMNVLVTVVPLCVVILLVFSATRKLGLISLVLTALSFGATVMLFNVMGMVRLLGLGHVVFWTPLLVILVQRLRQNPPATLPRIAMIVMAVIIGAALVFDYWDVFRWITGERGSIV